MLLIRARNRGQNIDFKNTIIALEKISDIFYKRAKAILDEFPEDFLKELKKSLKLSAKDFEEKIDITLKAMHIFYLTRGRRDIYHLNILLYAYKLAYKSKIKAAPLLISAALARFLK